jgi:hypothetical protein
MNEQEFQKEILEIKGELRKISKNTHTPVWRSFVTGTLSGLGSVVGVAIALTIIGWILNIVGVIPAFKAQVTHIEQTLDSLRK